MATSKKSKFLQTALANVNKTKDEVIAEEVQDFVENSIIEIETQIASRQTNSIPMKELELKKAKSELVKAEKKLTTTRFSIYSSFEYYLERLNSAKSEVSEAEATIVRVNADIKELEGEVISFKEILADFQA